MAPKNWQILHLGDILGSIRAGVSVHGEDRPASNGEIGVLKLSSVADGRFEPSEHKTAAGAELGRLGAPLKKGTILISRSNTIDLVGAAALVDRDYPHLYAPDLLWQAEIADREAYDPQFVVYLLNSPAMRRCITAVAAGTSGSMKKLSMGRYRRIPALVPSRPEQNRIREVLSLWDSIDALLVSLIRRKQDLKRGMMQQLLTGKWRLPGFTEPLRQYHLGELFTERNECGRADLLLLSITADRGVIPRTEVDRKDLSNEDKSRYKRITPGDIGYNTMRMWQGVSALSNLEGIVSPAYTVCTPNDLIHGQFAAYLFKFSPLVHLFHRHSQGMVDDTLSLKFPNFVRIKVGIPSAQEQKRIAEVLGMADKELDLLRCQLECLRDQKKGLMQKLLTGQIRVKGGGRNVAQR